MAELIVALDFDDSLEALNMASTLQGTVNWVKVGLELFITEGPRIIHTLKGMKYKVFLDLKLHDIPNTVKGAVLASATTRADMLTLHVSGGEKMVKAAIEAVQKLENKPLLMGVTILTSIAQGEFPCYSGDLTQLTQRLADEAYNWQLNGIVCSGLEVENIKKRHSKLLTLCPGIRLPENQSDDQKRVITPYDAVQKGADYIVVGRPITKAANPLEAAKNILADMERS